MSLQSVYPMGLPSFNFVVCIRYDVRYCSSQAGHFRLAGLTLLCVGHLIADNVLFAGPLQQQS